MSKPSLTPLQIVCELNDQYYWLKEDDSISPFSFISNGITDVILFMEYPLWSSEADGYDYEADGDTQVPLEITVRKLYAEMHAKIINATPALLFDTWE
jgi:hypothetical protein